MKRALVSVREFADNHADFLRYLICGGLTTLLNIAVYGFLASQGVITAIANMSAWVVSVAFAYISNKLWVFRSMQHTIAELFREFFTFVGCRLGTGLMDEVIMIVGVDLIGPRLFAEQYLVYWGIAIKLLGNVIVVLLNYIFSKKYIFRR